MDKLVPISGAADVLGVSVTTLRRWEREGKLKSDRTHAGHRRYDLSKIKPELFHTDDSGRKTIAYARVSSHDQKTDLERQKTGVRIVLRQARLDIRSDCRSWFWDELSQEGTQTPIE